MNNFQKILFATTLLLLSAGCGVADMAYNKAPDLIASELEDAFDLSEAQSDQLGSRLEQFFKWHRNEELARYREFLDRAALTAADGITAAEFLSLRDEVGAAWDRSLEKAIDSLGELAVSLTPEQIDRYDQYHREGAVEFQDYLEKSPQQREISRVNRAYERLENWFGDFDYYLGSRISERLRQVPDIYEAWLEYRDKRHQALITALRDDAGKTFNRQRLKKIMLDPSTDFGRAFEPARRAYWRAYAAALEDISSWLSDQQRQRAITRLQRYARVVGSLSGQG